MHHTSKADHKLNADAPGLIVPIDLTALCVGTIDQSNENGTSTFAGATTTFTNQTGIHEAFLGSNVTRALTDAPLKQLKQGIHLHWALPEAMTRGKYDKVTEKTSFPTAPNRWLLSRIIITATSRVRKSWIIESDFVFDAGTQIPAGTVVTLPVKTTLDNEQNYRYIGNGVEFKADWKEPSDPDKFRSNTNQDLTVVSSGDVSFAAFYPNSRCIFGFYDDASDIGILPGKTVDIMYQVTGWYGKTANDPLNGGMDLKNIQDELGWTFVNSTEKPGFSCYYGIVQNLEWSPEKKYVVDSPNQKPIKASVTVGNNPPETFSAYFKNLLHPGTPFFEQLLDAFQMGLLSSFQLPDAGQLALLREMIHQKQFNANSSGTIYLVIQKPDQQSINDPYNETPATDLPLQLEISLNLLNVAQQQYDFYYDYIENFKWQLFSNWYRLMKADTDELKNRLYNIIAAEITTYTQELAPKLKSLLDKAAAQELIVKNQIDALNAERRLKPALELKPTPASTYWQPNEPTILITSDDLTNNLRYGHTGKTDEGYLLCRVTDQTLVKVVVNKKDILNTQFADVNLPGPNKLPYPDLFNTLVRESCMLNTNIVAVLSGIAAAELEKNLELALESDPQNVYAYEGYMPASIAVDWFHGNPWSPVMVIWETGFAPIQLTQNQGVLQNYENNFFLDNYKVNPDVGSFVEYTGPADPKEVIKYNKQTYTNSAILSPSAADSFKQQLNGYLKFHQDETLKKIYDDLKPGKFLSFAANGFSNALTMQELNMQLNIKVLKKNPYYPLTTEVSKIIQGFFSVSPMPTGSYNPIRAGYTDIKLVAVDVFGQKRSIQIDQLLYSDALTTWYNGQNEPGIIYMPPRISQSTRLIFRWLSATSDGTQEMNSHPATSPVCGWLLPNHLDASLFFYDQGGKALGNMFLNGNDTTIMWQSAPGDNNTINKSVADVFEYQNAQYKALALALYNNTPAFFMDFWKSIDSMHNFVNPQNFAQNSDLAVLIGRPVAVTQAILRMETEGGPLLNQSWNTLKSDDYETDNEFSKVNFPVVIGDLKNINDGMIGYFKQGTSGYDFNTFYSEAADGKNGIIKPPIDNILLTPSPKLKATDPVDMMQDAVKILMLVDPRASVSATCGIMPTTSIDIPPDQYTDTISTLEMTFLTTPVLQGVTGFNMPLPREQGYHWSWVEEDKIAGKTEWIVIPEINYTADQAIAAYTPQVIKEGWLRLNPQLLGFSMVNAAGQPVAVPNTVNQFTLSMENKKPVDITFEPGELVFEGEPNKGGVFYIHFGKLIAQDKVPDLDIKSDNWAFKAMNSVQYGNYWAATSLKKITLGPGGKIDFNITKAEVANIGGQVQVYFDYYDITGINDGTEDCMLTLVGS